MTSVNIRLEVSDDIYDNVIRPLKDERRLQQFLRSVFENYMTNEDFRTFMDGGSLYADDEEITQLFNKLNEANTLAATGGFLVDNLTNEVNQGMSNIENGFIVGNEDELDLDSAFGSDFDSADQILQQGTAGLEEKVSNIENSVMELREMFKSFMQNAQQGTAFEPIKVDESSTNTKESIISNITPIAVASDDEEIEGFNIMEELDEDFDDDDSEVTDNGLDPLMASAFMSI